LIEEECVGRHMIFTEFILIDSMVYQNMLISKIFTICASSPASAVKYIPRMIFDEWGFIKLIELIRLIEVLCKYICTLY